MVLSTIFTDDGYKHTYEENRKKKRKGHAPEMLIPIMKQLDTLARNGNNIVINKKIFTFKLYVSAVPLGFFFTVKIFYFSQKKKKILLKLNIVFVTKAIKVKYIVINVIFQG